MHKQELFIPRKLATQLLHLAQQSPDQEICGLVGGKSNTAHHCYPVSNVAETPDRRFLLDPQQQITAMKTIRDRDEELWAVYHSHPNAPAFPSSVDLQQLSYPESLLLIISLNTKGVLEMRGFQFQQGQLEEVTLNMIEM